MRADNTRHLAAASARRTQQTLQRAEMTLQRMIQDEQPLSVAALCRQAHVSRSWLYTQPSILEVIAAQRPRPSVASKVSSPAASASEASLLQRLSLAHERNRSLSTEVEQLRDQLAVLYGQLRSLGLNNPTLNVTG